MCVTSILRVSNTCLQLLQIKYAYITARLYLLLYLRRAVESSTPYTHARRARQARLLYTWADPKKEYSCVLYALIEVRSEPDEIFTQPSVSRPEQVKTRSSSSSSMFL
jgi:hypothetical protein